MGKGDKNNRVKDWDKYWSAPIWEKLKKDKDEKTEETDKETEGSN